jgi:hypothetical protein
LVRAWVPVWQLAQPITMPAWFMVAGLKAVVDLWQFSQGAVVGIWLAGGALGAALPKRSPALWHAAQPLAIPAWFIVATAKFDELLWQLEHGWVVGRWLAGLAFDSASPNDSVEPWQASHDCVVGRCVTGLPDAALPLWQEAQLPATTPTCVTLAGVQATVTWQLSHDCAVRTCLGGLPGAVRSLWQALHEFGAMPVCAACRRFSFHESVRWQVSHACVVGTCAAGMLTAE